MKKCRWQLFILALIDLFLSTGTRPQQNSRSGIVAIIFSFLFSALEEIWDLVEHYMIPSVAIENKGLKDSVQSIKKLRNHIPETLVGVFGLDFAGDVFKAILLPVHLVFLLFGVVIGHFLVGIFPTDTVVTIGNHFSLSWYPVFWLISISYLLAGLINVTVDSIKFFYFTIFYTALNRAQELNTSMQEKLQNFLVDSANG